MKRRAMESYRKWKKGKVEKTKYLEFRGQECMEENVQGKRKRMERGGDKKIKTNKE